MKILHKHIVETLGVAQNLFPMLENNGYDQMCEKLGLFWTEAERRRKPVGYLRATAPTAPVNTYFETLKW